MVCQCFKPTRSQLCLKMIKLVFVFRDRSKCDGIGVNWVNQFDLTNLSHGHRTRDPNVKYVLRFALFRQTIDVRSVNLRSYYQINTRLGDVFMTKGTYRKEVVSGQGRFVFVSRNKGNLVSLVIEVNELGISTRSADCR